MNESGTKIGRYELLELLGSGGMAEVYKARLTGPGRASKPVALKLIRPQLANDGQFVLMFLDELRIALALSHRNIVQTFDGGEADGHYFLAMELVQGPSLASLLKGLEPHTPVPTDLALFITEEICAALDHAHRYVSEDPEQPTGVMHRDVSPGNILLSEQGDVKLTDFGVAKATGRIVVTMTDLVKGKLTYMSPEQARGTVTPVSDLYSLGAVLYEMLTRQPIRKQATLEEARLGHLQVPPLRKLRPELSPTLEEVVMQCLATEPSQRPATARDLLLTLSTESRRIPLDEARPLDPRMRLQIFLARKDVPADQQERVDRAQRLAQVMISEAEDVPEDSALSRGLFQTLPALVSEGSTSSRPDDATAPGPDDAKEPGPVIAGAPTAPDPTTPIPEDIDAPIFEENLESEGLPLTDLIAAEALPRRDPRWRVGLIAGVLGVSGLAALIWLWQDSAPVEDPQRDADSQVVARASAEASPAGGPGAAGSPPRIDLEPRPAPPSDRGPVPVPAVGAARDELDSGGAGDRRELRSPPAPSRSAARSRRRAHRRPAPPPGILNLNSDPWAKVYVDGKYRGETPLQGLKLSPGRHRLTLRNPQRDLSARVVVQIRAGKTLVKVVKLTPQ